MISSNLQPDTRPHDFVMADLFCGAGGTSTGALEALHLLGRRPHLTAVVKDEPRPSKHEN